MASEFSLDALKAYHDGNYGGLLNHYTMIENSNYLSENIDLENDYWSFTVYTHKRVAALYMHSKNPSQIVKQAYEENMSLIEICTGDYEKPLHIVAASHVDIEHLRKKWCLEYFAYSQFLVNQNHNEEELGELAKDAEKCMN